jgi:hypothetical protein
VTGLLLLVVLLPFALAGVVLLVGHSSDTTT